MKNYKLSQRPDTTSKNPYSGLCLTAVAGLILLLMSLTACGRSGNANQPTTGQTPHPTTPTATSQNQEHYPATQEEGLYGEFTILVRSFGPGHIEDNNMLIYAHLFNEIHPNVQVNIDSFAWPTDMSLHAALITRLIANPPDMVLFSPSALSFEKLQHEAVFMDLNTFIDGPNGINRDNYFDNIFRGAELRNSLFNIPLTINFGLTFLNTRLFEAIGVDVSQITQITMDQELYYHQRIAEAFPDQDVYLNRLFTPMQILEREHLYNIETKEVFVNTPQMQQRMHQALQIPIAPRSNNIDVPGGIMSMTPEGRSMSFSNITPERIPGFFLSPSNFVMWDSPFNFQFGDLYIMFVRNMPNAQFSQPVLQTNQHGYIDFRVDEGVSIMRNAQRPDLAWEFLRFILEFEYDMGELLNELSLEQSYYMGLTMALPVNRARFENQAVTYIEALYSTTRFYISTGRLRENIFEGIPFGYGATFAIETYRNAMNTVNNAVQHNNVVLSQLIHPDIWLLYSGQQDVYRALANIQSRLELYVHE